MSREKIPYRLGIDIGTGSVAWAAMAVTDKGVIDASRGLVASGTTIFGEPVLPKEMKLKNEVRRTARLLRRQTERKRERLQKLMHITTALGIKPEDLAAALRRYKNTQELWHIRVRAIDQKIDLAELMLIVLRMSKNRGYNGDAPSPSKKGDYGKAGQALQITETLKAKYCKARSIAEVLWMDQLHKPMNQRNFRKLNDAGTYVLRTDVKDEFELIFAEQKKHHPILNAPLSAIYGVRLASKLQDDQTKPIHHGEDANWNQGTKYFWAHSPESVSEAIEIALFYQHPLQGFKDKIGKCAMDKTSLRVIAAHPAHQSFRVEKLLADLRWGGNKGEPLSKTQKDLIRQKLSSQKEVGFGALYKDLQKAGCMHEDALTLNFHTPRRDHLVGNTTRQLLAKYKLLDRFEALTTKQQGDVFVAWADDIPAPESWGHDTAKATVTELYGEAVTTFIDVLANALGGLDRPSAAGFGTTRTAYGVKALEQLLQYMREHEVDESSACKALYPNHDTRAPTSSDLPKIETLDIRSPVVTHALEYTRREIQTAIKRLGMPTSIVVELAKEMKSTLEERADTTSRQNREEKENELARKEILAANCRITSTSILRYKLWKQQAKRCPYSGQLIASIEEAISGSQYQIEHIIPKRKHGVGNRMSDVVLASTQYNSIKGDAETPFHAAQRVGQANWDWERTEQAIRVIASESKDFRLKAKLIGDKTDFKDTGLDDDGFVDRQLQETQWIGRVVQAWCSSICDDVTVVRGGLTAELRRAWGMHNVLEEVRVAEGRHDSEKAKQLFYKPNLKGEMRFDKRCDHRHHLIDACVIALSTRGDYIAMVKARNARAELGRSSYRPPPCPVASLRGHLVKMLNGYTVWHVPDHLVAGEMYDQPFGIGANKETLFKKGKLDRRKFKSATDKIIQHTDRKNQNHSKAVVKSETACIRVIDDGFEIIGLAEFRAQYFNHKKLAIPKGQKLLFKGDLLILPKQTDVYRIGFSSERGLHCLSSNETNTFDNLSGTGLNKIVGQINDIKNCTVFRHPIELALHSKALKTQSA
jgi:CRISPR-associated endonuclease Csn1